jgi:ribosomal protein S18 acetylase RimI-like enzyme
MTEKLDNPVWHSLSETHQQFSIDAGNIKFYHPDFCPFGGFQNSDQVSSAVDNYAESIDNFFIVGERPSFSKNMILLNELVCLQMVIEKNIGIAISENIIQLNNNFEKELFDLVNLVQPGYFKIKTSMLGDYYGIFRNGQLVAVTGERMNMNGFTEVSAVVTHPLYTGKGFAKQLITYTVSKIISEDKMPCLHVARKNTTAIHLYERLGFVIRREISFWNLIKK